MILMCVVSKIIKAKIIRISGIIKSTMSQRRKKVEFVAEKPVSQPVRVEFYNKEGQKVVFKGHKTVKKPVKIEFYAKRPKKN